MRRREGDKWTTKPGQSSFRPKQDRGRQRLTPHSADVTDVLCTLLQDNQAWGSLESLLLQYCIVKRILASSVSILLGLFTSAIMSIEVAEPGYIAHVLSIASAFPCGPGLKTQMVQNALLLF
ncbi:hypothetical protein GBF38_020174 [Nibea albiflora]|uniref:Uncharacterized protein n=1 Tax=Nibea albiflora TaxID=240163 RepID=A0ACB7FEI1_NIBAL|nr:hypothetical protein GBF38_020174 [Nibea albiflora]